MPAGCKWAKLQPARDHAKSRGRRISCGKRVDYQGHNKELWVGKSRSYQEKMQRAEAGVMASG
eukprot:668633-Pelagomonas_calceolata.AAC.2